MTTESIFIPSILLFAGVGVFVYIRMIIFLRRRGEKIDLLKFRLMFPYLSRYQKIAGEESGSINLFHYWLVSINCALLCFILYLLMQFVDAPVIGVV